MKHGLLRRLGDHCRYASWWYETNRRAKIIAVLKTILVHLEQKNINLDWAGFDSRDAAIEEVSNCIHKLNVGDVHMCVKPDVIGKDNPNLPSNDEAEADFFCRRFSDQPRTQQVLVKLADKGMSEKFDDMVHFRPATN